MILGQTGAKSTFTSGITKLEVAFFIDESLDAGCRDNRGVRGYLNNRKSLFSPLLELAGRSQATPDQGGYYLSQTLPGVPGEVHRCLVHVVIQRNCGPHESSLMP